jgi:hypothetical protein
MALAGATAIALGAASVTAAGELPLSGSVGSGYRSPADGTLTIQVTGRATQARLLDATAQVDGGKTVDSAAFCAQDPQADCRSDVVALEVDTTIYPDGPHRLIVTIRDAGGRTYTINEDLEVWNHRPTSSPTATLNVGGPGATPQGAGNGGTAGGAVGGASATSCASPQLSMLLAQKPLRVSTGVAVLRKNTRYRFTGRLTCVVNGKRRSAAKGAKIAVRNVVGGKTVRKPATAVGGSGKITLVLGYPSSRTIVFRYTAGDGKTSEVRIKVRIAQRKG